MDNSFFIRCKQRSLKLKRFHICTWEFTNSCLVEFGIEIDSDSVKDLGNLTLDLYIPWLENKTKISDFYSKLKNSNNSRFIFNDSVSNTTSLDGGQNREGVIHEFSGRNKLCLLPVKISDSFEIKKISLSVSLDEYNKKSDNGTDIYLRIGVEPAIEAIATKKKGVGKSTIIYDLKINESRNIPEYLLDEFKHSTPCNIGTCFCFHIIPNNYSITFFESEHLKNVRTLEFKPFKNYLADKRLKKNELMVVFSKKSGSESYSFFTIFTKERIGTSQFAIAILINIICGFLFAFPAIRSGIPQTDDLRKILTSLSVEFYLAILLALSLLLYFFLPSIASITRKIYLKVKSKFY